MKLRWQTGPKRVFDIAVAVIALVVLSPLLLLTAVAIWVTQGWPILFMQQRAGQGGAPFVMLKFRTMRDARTRDGELLADAERLTWLGRLLRATSVDELPELWNVLRGEMSLVGPRPLLMQYLNRYTAEQARRHEIRPGMTGWAQVNGRNAIGWEEKFALDVWYVDHIGFLTDMKILGRTVLQVFKRSGITAADHATMPEFQGNQQQ